MTLIKQLMAPCLHMQLPIPQFSRCISMVISAMLIDCYKAGKKGSYNDYAIQFEICEDALTDEKYFNEAFALAAELCAYLCKTYGIAVDGIVSH